VWTHDFSGRTARCHHSGMLSALWTLFLGLITLAREEAL